MNIISLCLSLLFFCFLCSGVCHAQPAVFDGVLASEAPKYEVRAVWLTTIGGIDWPRTYARSEASIAQQKQELCTILDRLRQAGINTVLLQSRVRATVIYPSAYEPWDGCMSGVPGKSPGYDPLAFAVEECHKRGMEIQAWVVTIPLGRWNGLGCRTLRKKHPDMVKKIGDEGFLLPQHPATARYLADFCREIVSQYDVDGIHLDYIRYPEIWKERVHGDVARGHITSIVRAIHDEVKSVKPWVKLSCSPIGKYKDLPQQSSYGWNAYSRVYQDARLWLQKGWMDQLFPMMYFQGRHFYPFAVDWAEQSEGKTVAAGLAAYMLSPKEKNWDLSVIERELYVSRSLGLGQAFFRSKFFTDNTKGIYDLVKNEVNRYPALIPPISHNPSTVPEAPRQFKWVKTGQQSVTLSWNAVPSFDDKAGAITYNIYASDTYPVDIKDTRNLLISYHPHTTIHIPYLPGNRFFAITAINRLGQESVAIQENENDTALMLQKQWLTCKNDKLQVPTEALLCDATHLLVETLAGQTVSVAAFNSKSIVVSHLPEGVYSLRTLNKKGVTHRLGYFIIRRHKS